MSKKLKFIFECDDCKKEFKSWAEMSRHLNANIDHAPEGYGLVNVYRREDIP